MLEDVHKMFVREHLTSDNKLNGIAVFPKKNARDKRYVEGNSFIRNVKVHPI